MSGTCFSIMPFCDDYKPIDAIIRRVAESCGLEYVRGDHETSPGNVMSQILHEIDRATVVVADISERNPNVFYELGIAHQLKTAERVVLLTRQVDEKLVFDIHQFRQIPYIRDAEGLRSLEERLPEMIRSAQAASVHHTHWNVLRGRLPRTKSIARDLLLMFDSLDEQAMARATIRIAAGLGSLAIADDEPADSGTDVEYRSALLAERNALCEVLKRGAHMKAVLNPPRSFTRAMLPARLRARYQRLIALLEGRQALTAGGDPKMDLAALERCQFVLSPVIMPNVFIIADRVAYEGMKRGGAGGFEMTHCETRPDELRAMIGQFDLHFGESCGDDGGVVPAHAEVARRLRGFYGEAAGEGLEL